MGIKIITPGALTTVQDGGRNGFLQYGISGCGAMDIRALEEANHLVGNADKEAVFEMTLFGAVFEFTEDRAVAVTGADMCPVIISKDGKRTEAAMYETLYLNAGDRLVCGMAKDGCRAYLAVAAGLDFPEVMGSRSTDLKGKIGGFCGRKLQPGDYVPLKECVSVPKRRSLEKRSFSQDITVRVVGGPQEDSFTDKGLETFYASQYTLTAESDRMGMRLAGPKVETKNGSDIISDGTVFGSIQVTSAGLPIILMADRQTTGGYAKPATVCSFDLPLLAQARPGAKIRFKKISIEEAQKCYTAK